MRRFLLVLLALLIAAPCYGQDFPYFKKKAGTAAPACSTPATGDEMHEGFLGTGYELGEAWSEVGTGTIDEDAALSGAPPAGSCTEGLHIVAADSASYAQWDRGSALDNTLGTTVYLEFYVSSTTTTQAAYSYTSLMQFGANTGGGNYAVKVELYKSTANAGVPNQYRCYGSTGTSPAALSADAWHTLAIHLDATGDASTCSLDGGAAATFTRGTYASRYMAIGGVLGVGAGEALNVEFGRVYIDTP